MPEPARRAPAPARWEREPEPPEREPAGPEPAPPELGPRVLEPERPEPGLARRLEPTRAAVAATRPIAIANDNSDRNEAGRIIRSAFVVVRSRGQALERGDDFRERDLAHHDLHPAWEQHEMIGVEQCVVVHHTTAEHEGQVR